MSEEARLDFETKSDVDLRTHGAPRYFASPHWAALGASYRIDDGPLRDWERGEPCPDDLRAHIEAGGYLRAWNASFERQCLEQLHAREGWPLPAIDRYRCTAAEAAAMGLPRSLDDAGTVLGLEVQKDKRGSALIRKFCMPRRPRKDEDPSGIYWNEPEDRPEDYQAFVEYRRRDVETEEAAARRIIRLSDFEQRVYTLDQIICSRGLRIDVKSAAAAISLAEKAKKALDADMIEATGGYVTACSQAARLTEWIVSRGAPVESVQKGELEDLLHDEFLPPDVRRAIEIRLEAAKASVSKLSAMLNRVSADGRVRGAYLYHAAGTGRWSSTGVQVHNLPRPRKVFEDAHLRLAPLFQAIRAGEPDTIRELYCDPLGRPLHLLADAIRGFIWAAPGHDLVVADYSGIEGAVAAWLAREEWKVQALHELTADPSLPDLYRRAAAGIFNTTTDLLTKKDPRRQVGKVSELALQYGGGVGAFVSMAKGYGMKLDPLFEPVWAAADAERRAAAVKRYERCLRLGQAQADAMSREAWLACEIVKVGWRALHPAICAAWRILETAARKAIEYPGQRVDALGGAYVVRHGFLWRLLPSGRCLAYASPKLTATYWCVVDGAEDAETLSVPEIAEMRKVGHHIEEKGPSSSRISAAGVDSQTRRFTRYGLYGGLLFENDVQALARDLLVSGMLKAEEAGYPVIGHVHDEIITEVPRGFGDVHAFERLICELPEWAAGLPLKAEGWRGKRYRK